MEYSKEFIEKNKEFLKKFKFKQAGDFVLDKNDNNKLEFDTSVDVYDSKVNGYFVICENGIIKSIHESFGKTLNIYKTLNSGYKTGGSFKINGNCTWNRVNRKMKKSLQDNSNNTISALFVKCSKSDVELNIIKNLKDEYQKIFSGEVPEWDITLKEYIKCDNNKEKIFKAIHDDDLDELNSNSGTSDTKRSQKVRNAALENTKNMCCCDINNNDPCKYFNRRKKIKNNTKYLEVHHLVPLWSEKLLKERYAIDVDRKQLDVIENTVCLCSNCHRKIHNGQIADVKEMLNRLYKMKENDLKKAGLNISISELIEIYNI